MEKAQNPVPVAAAKQTFTGTFLLGFAVLMLLGPANPYQVPSLIALERYPATSLIPDEDLQLLLARDAVVRAELTDLAFHGFLKYQNYQVDVKDGELLRQFRGGYVYGPGHHVSAVAALLFDEQLLPHVVLKSGDTRLSRSERKEAYVLDGYVAGRMDKAGAESSKIALMELAEEVGGEIVEGTFNPLGSDISPTMPFESTESDMYFVAAVKITGEPYGDGGGMELVELIGPKVMTASRAIEAMDKGQVSDGSRARTMYGRAFDSIGYIPKLEIYVQDQALLLERYSTLGLGPVVDIRKMDVAGVVPEVALSESSPESRVNDVVYVERREVLLGDGVSMIVAKTRHAVKEGSQTTEVGPDFSNEYLKLKYDRAKFVSYYWDASKGPMVQMTPQVRAPLAFAPQAPEVIRFDVKDLKIPRGLAPSEEIFQGAHQLGKANGASSGQSDLYYQFWAKDIGSTASPEKQGFVPLNVAIERCRTGHGDAQTEALLERLADALQWIPTLNMSVYEAKRLIR